MHRQATSQQYTGQAARVLGRPALQMNALDALEGHGQHLFGALTHGRAHLRVIDGMLVHECRNDRPHSVAASPTGMTTPHRQPARSDCPLPGLPCRPDRPLSDLP